MLINSQCWTLLYQDSSVRFVMQFQVKKKEQKQVQMLKNQQKKSDLRLKSSIELKQCSSGLKPAECCHSQDRGEKIIPQEKVRMLVVVGRGEEFTNFQAFQAENFFKLFPLGWNSEVGRGGEKCFIRQDRIFCSLGKRLFFSLIFCSGQVNLEV